MQFDRREKVPSLCRQRERPFFPLFLKIMHFQMVAQFGRRIVMHFAKWVRFFVLLSFVTKGWVKRNTQQSFFSLLPFVTKRGSKRNTKTKIFIFHWDAQFHHLPLMHSANAHSACSWRNSSHLPIAQNGGGKTKHHLKNLHFLQKWEQDSYCELRSSSSLYRTNWGSKRKYFLKISQKFFRAAKMPGANA